MTNKEAVQAVQMQQWSEMVRECQDSGMSVKSWCAAKEMSRNTYFYRQKRVRKAVCQQLSVPQSCIAEVMFPQNSCQTGVTAPVIIHIDSVAIEVNSGADEQTIVTALRAISKL